jgi:hypothetical protein
VFELVNWMRRQAATVPKDLRIETEGLERSNHDWIFTVGKSGEKSLRLYRLLFVQCLLISLRSFSKD